GSDSDAEQIAELAEETVRGAVQAFEAELPGLLESRAIPQIEQRARRGAVAHQPVGTQLVVHAAAIRHAVDLNAAALAVHQPGAGACRVLTDEAEKERAGDLVFELDSGDRLAGKARAVAPAVQREPGQL